MADELDLGNDENFQSLLAQCLEAEERGEKIDRDQLWLEHPKYADSICEFLDNNGLLDLAWDAIRTHPPRPSVDSAFAPTLDSLASDRRRPFAIGDRLRYIGEYELLEEIARGGMGIVFRARQIELRRTVALKMILAGRLASEADVDRFHREARAAAALQHPNIVGVYEVGRHEGHHYFTMDFVDGESLAHKISKGSLPPRRTAELIKAVAEAIAYAHQRGILHRDLKPANILIDQNGTPLVTDFGLAKTLVDDATDADLTATGQVLGTPSYMSPEQASAKHQLVCVASDVYSLGAIMYACISGRAPFVSDSTVDTIRQVIEKEPVPLRLLNLQVPKDLETICLKCLQKEPHRRYGTAGELAQDLNRFLEGRPVVARPVPAATKLWRWGKRNPAIASVSGLAALFLLIGSIVSTYFALEASTQAKAEKRARVRESEAFSNALASQTLAEENAETASREFERAEGELYYSRLANARLELLGLRPQNALEILGEMRNLGSVALGWEWHYLNRVCQRERFTVAGRWAAFVTGGKQLATVDLGGVRLYDSQTGEPSDRLESNLEKLVGITASPSGELLAVTDGKSIEVWDIQERTIRHSWNVAYETWIHFEFDFSGQKLVVLSGLSRRSLTVPVARGSEPRKNVAAIYSMSNGQKLRQLDAFSTSESVITFSPDGKELVTFDRKNLEQPITKRLAVHVLEIESGERKRSMVPFDRFLGVGTLQFSPDGQTLALSVQSGSEDAEPVLLDWSTGESKNITLESLKKYGQNLRRPQFSPRRNELAGYTENVVMIWNPSSGKLVGTIAERSTIRNLAWSPDGDAILTVTAQGIRVWDARKLRPERVIQNTKGSWVSVSNDGKRIATTTTLKVLVSEMDSGDDVFVLPGNSNGTHDAAFGPGGNMLATGGASWTDRAMTGLEGDVRFWSLEQNGEAKMTFKIGFGGLVSKVAISTDGRRAAFRALGQKGPAVPDTWTRLDYSERLVLVDVANQKIMLEIPTKATGADFKFSPDGKLLVVASGNAIKLYDAQTGTTFPTAIETLVANQDPQRPSGLDFLANEKKLVVYYGTDICINDMTSGKILSHMKVHADGASVASIKIDPTGKRVFLGCSDGVIRVFSPSLGKTLLELRGHTSSIQDLEITPDGNKLVSTSYDQTARVWDGSLLQSSNTQN